MKTRGNIIPVVIHESHEMDASGNLCVECMACLCHLRPGLLERECVPVITSDLRRKIKK